MMRLTKRVFSAFLAFVMVFTMLPLDAWAADGTSDDSLVAPLAVPSGPEAVGLELDQSSAVIQIDGTAIFVPTVTMEDGSTQEDIECTWESDNLEVARVTAGVVTGVSEGTAKITCTYGELTTFAMVTVTKATFTVLYKSNYQDGAKKYIYKYDETKKQFVSTIETPNDTTYNETYNPGESVTVAENIFTTINYQLTGFKDEEGTIYNPGQSLGAINKNYTLVAQWKEIPGASTAEQTIQVVYHKTNYDQGNPKYVSATVQNISDNRAQVTFLTANIQDALGVFNQTNIRGWTIDGNHYEFNQQVTVEATKSRDDQYWRVDVYPWTDSTDAGTAPAQFYVRKSETINEIGSDAKFYYSVGGGTIKIKDSWKYVTFGDQNPVAGNDNRTTDVSDYIVEAPSAAQIANLMNLELEEAASVRWYVIKKSDNGYHVDGYVYSPGKYWKVEFVDPDSNRVVNMLLIKDQQAITEPMDGSELNTPLRTFKYWSNSEDGAEVNLSTIEVTQDIKLYAVFERKSGYTVEYYLDGVKQSDAPYDDAPTSDSADIGTQINIETQLKGSFKDGNGNNYVLDTHHPESKLTIESLSATQSENVLKVYYASDNKGGGNEGKDPDGTPDKYQVIFRYVSADPATGRVNEPTFEVKTNEKYTTDGGAKPTGTTVQAADGYKFLKWTRTGDTAEDTNEGMDSFIRDDSSYKWGSEVIFTVHFTERDDLEYTINYYWVGDKENSNRTPINASETKSNGTLDQTVKLTDSDIPTIAGYTVVRDKYEVKITADKDQNVINVYYYKNVVLQAEDTQRVYTGDDITVNVNYSGVPAGVKFDNIVPSGTGKYVGEYNISFPKGTLNQLDEKCCYIITEANPGTLTITAPEDPQIVSKTHKEGKYYPGDKITFEITVKNIFRVPAEVSITELEGVVLEDDAYGAVIPAGGEETFKAYYLVDKDDLDNFQFTNNVTVTLTPKGGGASITDSDEDVVEISVPSLKVEKEVVSQDKDKDNKYDPEEVIRYKIILTNTGNVELTNVILDDNFTIGGEAVLLTPVAQDFDGSLSPNESVTFTASYSVTEADLGKTIVNIANASAECDGNKVDVDNTEGTTTTYTEDPNPELTVQKKVESTGTGLNGKYKPGDVVEYFIQISNTGNMKLYDVRLEDMFKNDADSETSVYVQPTLISPAGFDGALKQGETVSYQYSYTVTEQDLGKTIRNSASADGFDGQENVADIDETEGTVDVIVEEANPQLVVKKEEISNPGEDGVYDRGETIEYQITVSNMGNVTLTGVDVTDVLYANNQKLKDLKLEGANDLTLARFGLDGSSKTFNVSYTVTEDDLGKTLYNTATATAENMVDDPDNPGEQKPVTGEDTTDGEEIAQPSPDMTVFKRDITEKAPYRVGDVVTYEITVENTGNTTLHNLTLTDNMNAAGKVTFQHLGGGKKVGNGVTLASLSPDKTWVVTCRYTIQKEDAGKTISNGVTVISHEQNGDPEKEAEHETPDEDVRELYTLTIRYENGAGVQLRDSYVGQFHEGDDYSVATPVVAGYHLSKNWQKTITGTMPAENRTIVVVYARNPVEDDDDDPVVNPDNDPDETTEETEDEVDPGVYIEDPDDYTLTPITEEETPLADLDVGDHTCCIMHFLLMLAAMVVLGFYTDSKKKHQARIFELKRTLAMEKGKNPDGDNSQQS